MGLILEIFGSKKVSNLIRLVFGGVIAAKAKHHQNTILIFPYLARHIKENTYSNQVQLSTFSALVRYNFSNTSSGSSRP